MDAQALSILSLFGVLLLLSILGVLAALIYRTVQATITGFSWSRDIFFEHYVWVEESSLAGFPSGSINQSWQEESYQSLEFVRFNVIITTYPGSDGQSYTTTTLQPVYEWVTRWRTRYFYDIQRWVRSRELHTEGTERATRHWPTYQLKQSTRERVEKNKEKYLVFFETAKGKQLKRELPENEWATLDEQATYTFKINFVGHVKQFFPETQQAITAIKQIP